MNSKIVIIPDSPEACIFSRRCIGGQFNLALSFLPSVDFTNFNCWFKLTILDLKFEEVQRSFSRINIRLLLQPCGSMFRNIFPKITWHTGDRENGSFQFLFDGEGSAGFEWEENVCRAASILSPMVEMEWAFPRYLADVIFKLNLEVITNQLGRNWTKQKYSFRLILRPYCLGKGNSKDIFPVKRAWFDNMPKNGKIMPSRIKKEWNKFLKEHGLMALDLFHEEIKVCNVFLNQKIRHVLRELTEEVKTWLKKHGGKVETEACIPFVFREDCSNAIIQLGINQPFSRSLSLKFGEETNWPLLKLQNHHLMQLMLKDMQVLELWLVVQTYYCAGMRIEWRGGRFEALKEVPFAFKAIRFRYNSSGHLLAYAPNALPLIVCGRTLDLVLPPCTDELDQ